MSSKWGIGLENFKVALDITTQMNVRLSSLNLNKRYQTDLLSQKLRILSVKFYNDTLFADDTSVQGNKCAQIYTDGDGFVHVLPMR